MRGVAVGLGRRADPEAECGVADGVIRYSGLAASESGCLSPLPSRPDSCKLNVAVGVLPLSGVGEPAAFSKARATGVVAVTGVACGSAVGFDWPTGLGPDEACTVAGMVGCEEVDGVSAGSEVRTLPEADDVGVSAAGTSVVSASSLPGWVAALVAVGAREGVGVAVGVAVCCAVGVGVTKVADVVEVAVRVAVARGGAAGATAVI